MDELCLFCDYQNNRACKECHEIMCEEVRSSSREMIEMIEKHMKSIPNQAERLNEKTPMGDAIVCTRFDKIVRGIRRGFSALLSLCKVRSKK